MDKRPKPRLQLSAGDKMLEAAGWMVLIGLWIYTLFIYGSLPNVVPVHFNAIGQPDAYGSKITYLLLPAIASILFVGLTVLNRHPDIFNYAVQITAENAQRQYRNATGMIRVLKLILSIVFLIIQVKAKQSAINAGSGLGAWFLPLVLLLILVPSGYFVVRMFRNR